MMRHLLTSLALAFGLAGPAAAQTTEVARAALIPGWQQADGSHVVGLGAQVNDEGLTEFELDVVSGGNRRGASC